MVVLEQIGATLVASLTVHIFAIVAFGFAVRSRSPHIAPRCESRPRNVIYNPNPKSRSQDRGNPWLGWIPWVLTLSYEDMLRGVPGTGTRDGGLSGSMLRVNMDNIVMLRFHSFGLRVATVGLFIYTLIMLPLYWTAGCADLGTNSTASERLQDHCTNLTNYDWTTLANIVPETDLTTIEIIGVSVRLYVVVLCSWIVQWYACYELKQEWVDILAMRRYYFLESDHWKDRQADFERNVMSTSQSRESHVETEGVPPRRRRRRRRKKSHFKTEKDYVRDRDPWMPHPELRDTPPAIALYSVLVGGIPSMPHSAMDQDGDETRTDVGSRAESRTDWENANRQWQLSVTSAFFDHCIPNQPGFSSSVAAVTILPHANELANSWRKWYVAASKLRRLRFIRKQIRAKRHYEIESDSDEEEAKSGKDIPRPVLRHTTSASAYHDDNAAPRADYNREVFGSAMDDDVEELLMEALDFGPEQTAVYSREFAQSASPCCPNGCFEEAIVKARIDELLELEQIALEEVEVANLELEAARQNAVLNARTKEADYKGLKGKNDDGENGEKEKRRVTKVLGPELPLDLGVVKNLIEHDTVKNLMGRDASVPTENKRGVNGQNETLNGKFDLETKLFKSGQFQLNDSSDGEPEIRARKRNTARSRSGSPSRKIRGKEKPARRSSRSRIRERAFEGFDKTEAAPLHRPIAHPADQNVQAVDIYGARQLPTPGNRQRFYSNSEASLRHETIASMEHSVRHHRAPGNRQRLYSNSEASLRHETIASMEHAARGSFQRRPSRRQSVSSYNVSDAWALVDKIAMDSQQNESALKSHPEDRDERSSRVVSAGNWELSSLADFVKTLWLGVRKFLRWTTAKSNEAVDLMAADATYAVVTFTSRQAAVAARKVLADGRGSTRWVQLDTLPIPPLADAAACDLKTCRGCCRPVTLSINDRQKKWRRYAAFAALGTIYIFWTFPLTYVAGIANENLTRLFPQLQNLKYSFLSAELLSAMNVALFFAGFLAICPVLFKTIANFGSNANSTVEAEFSALKYFWWFMVVSAFSGTLLQSMIIEGFDDGIRIGSELQDVLRTIAATIPSEISPLWINWIIVKTSVTAPLMYMLQLNTFVLDWVRLKCCMRAVKGGGPGGPLPYRIYVDSGYVLLCLFALAPAAPLVAPCAFLYFLFSTPMLRRNVIFMYRPKFDAGGIRFPFLFEMCISGMFVGQLLLAIMMGLKKSLGPSVLAAAAFVPTLLFRDAMRDRYLRAFNDVGLLQTSLLDGWDLSSPQSQETREERRRFLVDSHKAAYVPVCMASSLTMGVLTAEPAVVVATMQEREMEQMQNSMAPDSPMQDFSVADISRCDSFQHQFGATLRRASTVITPHSATHPALSEVEVHIESNDQDIESQSMNQDSETGHFYDCVSVELDKQK